jgi:hypothetical protein
MGLFDHLYHLDWTAKYPLEYHYKDGRHVVFDKYEIDMFGNIYNKSMKQLLNYTKQGEYDMVGVYDYMKKQYKIHVTRGIVSTFHGKPPTSLHTTEHIECSNKDNNMVCELTWMEPSGQSKNRKIPTKYLSAYIIIRENLEMTIKEWVDYLNDRKDNVQNFTISMITKYAQQKQHGFSYKVYENLPGETWYKVANSENSRGRWEISDQNRIAYVSKFARNVIDATRFGFDKNHPKICVNGKNRSLHTIAFETYYPEAYSAMKPGEMILHKLDDKLDFRPQSMYIGNASDNAKDARDNGCHDGTKTARMPCISYINGMFEKSHESQDAAVKYLRLNGHPNASDGHISTALSSNKTLMRYGRTWTTI